MEDTLITAIGYAVRQASGAHALSDTPPKSEVPVRHNRKKISPSLTTWEVTLLTWPNLGGGATPGPERPVARSRLTQPCEAG